MSRPLDTSVDARRRQLDAYRSMSPDERLRLADQMSADARSLTRSGIRARHGGDSAEDEVNAELARILLGGDLAAAVAAGRRTRRR